MQQKKLFIWNMHYQYKFGDCKTYTVLVSLENTKGQLESKGTEACALTEAEKLKLSKPKQSRTLQVYTLSNKNRGGERESKTNNQRKALQNKWKERK